MEFCIYKCCVNSNYSFLYSIYTCSKYTYFSWTLLNNKSLMQRSMRYHFITSILFTVMYTIQVIIKDRVKRMNMIVPVLVLFYVTFILFSIEYDKKMITSWKRQEKKIIDRTFSKFIKLYYKNKPFSEILKEKEELLEK